MSLQRFANPALSRLHQRVESNFDFTLQDVILNKLKDLITCPILFTSSENMILFCGQCYDYDAFESYRNGEVAKYQRKVDSGYPNLPAMEIKNLRTNVMIDYMSAMDQCYKTHLEHKECTTLFLSRCGDVTGEEVKLYTPPYTHRNVSVNWMVKHIENLCIPREAQRTQYAKELLSRNRTASAQLNVQNTIPRANPNAVVEEPRGEYMVGGDNGSMSSTSVSIPGFQNIPFGSRLRGQDNVIINVDTDAGVLAVTE